MLSCPLSGHSAIYKWIDENGTVTFRDTPPPAGQEATIVEPKSEPIEVSAPVTAGGLFDDLKGVLGLSEKEQPAPEVELYVTNWCGYCKKARAYLRSQGISFKEYDIERDPRAARRMAKLNSRGGVPVAVINGETLIGFYQPAYEKALGLR
jgi:glutaredoxin-like YruB-family protein